MKIEDEVFLRYRVDFLKLKNFGFSKVDNAYVYFTDFMNDEFRAEIAINKDGQVCGKVIEKALGDTFDAIHVESFVGGFVNSVKEEYRQVLINIRDNCFTKLDFIYPQTNRLSKLIFKKYKERPDHPFAKLPTCCVFRYTQTKKWYALVMDIRKEQFIKTSKDKTKIEVMNLKIDITKREEILKIKGIYPAYHMNKQGWVSIILDDTVSDDVIMNLIDVSRNYATGNNTVVHKIK